MSEERRIHIEVPVLARVEGEGALHLRIEDGRIEHLQLRIFEPPRFFEKFLEGRAWHEVPDVVARICGICPVAYQMSAVQALEDIFAITPDPWVRAMRRVMYCGEWIQSHALHIHLLALPDFFGCNSVVELARDHAGEVRRGFRLQALGNDLIALFGGRSVHPVGVRVGGFHRAPDAERIAELLPRLEAGVAEAADLVRWCAGIAMPDDQQEFVSVALRAEDEYAMGEGRVVSSTGLDLARQDYDSHFSESHIAHSTALYSHLDGQPYLVGPLARLNLNHAQLPDSTRALLQASGLQLPSRNMFHSLLARALEIHLALVEAVRLLSAPPAFESAYQPASPRAGIGYGATEAPRGLLWHRYETAADGSIVSARIVPPTSQNQARMEEDLKQSLEAFGLDQHEDAIRLRGETVIRNYDPCISCATHFLRLGIEREPQ
ncbi:MAG: nickel-dependent hydrogenase large subunit [Xanthomonadaceae bacterium]|nr:nickel-dependent hydrogenase large subunit [Xanthomonadaceae bacterium]